MTQSVIFNSKAEAEALNTQVHQALIGAPGYHATCYSVVYEDGEGNFALLVNYDNNTLPYWEELKTVLQDQVFDFIDISAEGAWTRSH